MSGALPTVFFQRTERNERLASLLSSVYFRAIRPSFTPSIRRHPLSLWTLADNSVTKRRRQPIALFIEEASCTDSSETIARVLKKAVVDSGFLIAEIILVDDAVDQVERESALSNFNPDSDLFFITIKQDLLEVQELKWSDKNGSFTSSTTLVLVSGNSTDNSPFRPEIHRHVGDPNTTVVSLPASLSAYGDDGANVLWIIRTVLKWMHAAHTCSAGSANTPMLKSRL